MGKLVVGKNDLKTWCIKNNKLNLIQEWSTLNGDMSSYSYSSRIKVMWICDKKHEWSTRIDHRVISGSNCPYCSNHKVYKGFNDLKSWAEKNNRFDLINEWSSDNKNGMDEYTVHSEKKVWWHCKNGHKYNQMIAQRIDGNTNCPMCAKELQTSFPEKAIFYYLSKEFDDVLCSYEDLGFEIDIYIKSKKIAIEYDGYNWHKNRTKQDINKNIKCLNNGINLIRIRENGLDKLENSICLFRSQTISMQSLNEVICKLLVFLNIRNYDVDVVRDNIEILELYKTNRYNNSLEVICPQLLDKWDFDKNGRLLPSMFTKGSGRKVWWLCKNGHSYQQKIAARVNNSGCPICAGRIILPQYNDLETWCKNNNRFDLINEFSNKNEKEIKYYPSHGGKKLLWVCKQGHEYFASSNNRINGTNCPYCSNQKVISGYNDLKTWCLNNNYQFLLDEWNTSKNKDIDPSMVTPKTNLKYWWIGKCGHEWDASPNVRIRLFKQGSSGCPYCSNRIKKRVINLDTGEIFESTGVANKTYNLSKDAVYNCCKGIRKTAGGFRWAYLNEK